MRDNVCYAGFAVRFAAWLADMLIMALPMSILSVFRFALRGSARAVLFRYSALDIAAYALPTLYFIAMTWTQGATLGKMLFKLEVVSAERGHLTLWQTVLREVFGRYLSSAVLFIGYFTIVPDPQKRALHDMISDTRVIYACQGQPVTRPETVRVRETPDAGDTPS
ncbi:MAG: RDD family protein [Oscillibacter sp.]|nr:RDD family protein [Oscillibacter sp.]